MLRYLEIKKQLQDLIAVTTPGEKLADRVTLCRRFDTTRTTLDKAIRELVREGMLTSRKGSGTYVASSLQIAQQNAGSWCVIVPNIIEPIYNTLVSSIEKSAQQLNINVILCSSENNFLKQERFVRRLAKSGIAGFIIVPVITSSYSENQRLYSNLQELEIPLLFCNRSVDGINAPVVTSNNFYGGYIATKHFISRGYRKIAYISHRQYSSCIDRCQGYMSALMEAGLPINRSIIRMPRADAEPLNYYEEAKLLIQNTDIDAIFCFSDSGAFQVMNAILDSGLSVSDDIGVIGYNNSDSCTVSFPPLTSVSYETPEIGQKATEVLYNLCNNRKSSSGFEYYLFQPKLFIRESCKGPRNACI